MREKAELTHGLKTFHLMFYQFIYSSEFPDDMQDNEIKDA